MRYELAVRMYARGLVGCLAAVVVASGCAGRISPTVRPGSDRPAQVSAAASDTLVLHAVWSADVPAPQAADLAYWVTWVRNGDEVKSDTTRGLSDGVLIQRMGRGVPDTVIVTLWTLNHGVLSRRAHWQERTYRSAGPVVDTVDLGPAPQPDLSAPRPTPPSDSAAPAPVAAPLPVAAPAADSVRRVILRIMDPPPAWRAQGLDPDCVAGVRGEGPLTLIVLPETPEHCRPYVESYGGTPP